MDAQYKARVIVIRGETDENAQVLPNLFRKAAQFVKDNELEIEDIESIRYAQSFNEEFTVIPELRISVQRGSKK